MSIPKLFITTIVLAVTIRAAPQWYPQPDYFCPVVNSSEEVAGHRWQIGVNVSGGSCTQPLSPFIPFARQLTFWQ